MVRRLHALISWKVKWESSLLASLSLDGRGVWDTCICMAESLPCSPETTQYLFINWLYLKIKVKKKENTCLPNKQTHRKRDQMVGYQRREEERRELEDSGPKVQAFSYK